MEYISTQKYVRVSPKKARNVVYGIKGLDPLKAIDVLSVLPKKSASYIMKVLKTAVANAVQSGANQKDLIIKEIQVTDGPALKRGNPIARGMWHPIKKRMCHIRVVLFTKEVKKEVKKKGEKKNGSKS